MVLSAAVVIGALTLCMLGNFACFFVVSGFFFFFFFLNLLFLKKYFRNTNRVSNSLDPDQVQRFVVPDLGPNCLQRLSADDKSPLSGERVKKTAFKI